jgi:hypothetical protein
MGFEAPRPVLAPVADGEDVLVAPRSNPALGLSPASPVHAVQDELAHRLVSDAPEDIDAPEDVDETAELVLADPSPFAELLGEEAEPEAPDVLERPLLQVRPERAPIAKPELAPVVAVEPEFAPRSRASTGKAKAAFTLRLDQERHLKLRLACAVSGTSAQQLVTKALDELLAIMPELDAMASRAPERSAH